MKWMGKREMISFHYRREEVQIFYTPTRKPIRLNNQEDGEHVKTAVTSTEASGLV